MTREDFDALPAGDVEALRRFAIRRAYLPGTTLFRQGEWPKELLIIERGEVELVYETRSERLVVQILYPGSSVDHLAILLGIPYPYSAVTLAKTTLPGPSILTTLQMRSKIPVPVLPSSITLPSSVAVPGK